MQPSQLRHHHGWWAVTLFAYDYEICYKRGVENSNADALSRLPMSTRTTVTPEVPEVVLTMDMLNSSPPVNVPRIRTETARDPVMSQVMQWVRWGWPCKVDAIYAAYDTRRDELSIADGCLV